MKECPGYLASQYDPEIGFGKYNLEKKYQSENLEHQTFDSESFDIVITQDVFEHMFAPDLAIKEIARTLKIGGAHIMTVPIVMGGEKSRRRARIDKSGIEHLLEPQYHGNPLSNDGSLVTIDWGNDIVDYLAAHSGLTVSQFNIDDLTKGIRAVYNEVLVCRKLGVVPKL
jgi:SAM-dependent methyltransferase